MARNRKQKEIPGTERPIHPELDEAALEYAAARDARIAAGVTEKKKLDVLADTLSRLKLTKYEFLDEDGKPFEVTATPTKIKIKVKEIKNDDANNGEVDADAAGDD
jgi:hypothetical protein